MKQRLIGSIVAGVVIVSGCEEVPNKEVGALGGAAVGAAVGNVLGDGSGEALATVGGAVAGAAIGSEIGRYLDEQDQQELAQSTVSTAETGRSQGWSNPETGVSGRTRVVDETQATQSSGEPAAVPETRAGRGLECHGRSRQVVGVEHVGRDDADMPHGRANRHARQRRDPHRHGRGLQGPGRLGDPGLIAAPRRASASPSRPPRVPPCSPTLSGSSPRPV